MGKTSGFFFRFETNRAHFSSMGKKNHFIHFYTLIQMNINESFEHFRELEI